MLPARHGQARIRIGPAGWSYADWEGRVYPRSRPRGFHPLRFLANFVDCIEINSTFYGQPRAEHAAAWVRHVEPHADFRFLVKLLSEFTHAELPAEDRAWHAAAETFQAGIAPLARSGKLAALLVQFPVSFRHTPSALRRLGKIRSLFADGVAGRALPLVLEVRHRSWFEPPALDEIAGLGFSLAHLDLPTAWDHPPPWHTPVGSVGYLRLHGRNARAWFDPKAGRDQRYDWLYDRAAMEQLARLARRLSQGRGDTFVVTNNHFEGKAVANALDLAFLLGGEPVAAPADLVQTYPYLAHHTTPHGQRDLFG